MAAYRLVYDFITYRLTAKNRDQLRNPTLPFTVASPVPAPEVRLWTWAQPPLKSGVGQDTDPAIPFLFLPDPFPVIAPPPFYQFHPYFSFSLTLSPVRRSGQAL